MKGHCAWNEIQKIQNLFLHRQLRVKFSSSCLVILFIKLQNNVNVILNSCACIIFTWSIYYKIITHILGNSHVQDYIFVWFHRPNLDSYSNLFHDIIRFPTTEDIILSEDFNARTKDEQTTKFDTREAMYGEMRWQKKLV